MQLIKLTTYKRNGKLASQTIAIDINELATPIRFNANSKSYFILSPKPIASQPNTSGQRQITFECNETLSAIKALSSNLLLLTVTSKSRKVLTTSEQMIFNAAFVVGIYRTVTAGTFFYYKEDGNPEPVEYIVSESVDTIMSQQAVSANSGDSINKISFVGKPDAFGDSVVAGTGVTASQYSLISLLSTGNGYNGIAFRNLGVGGYGSLLTSIQAFSNQSTFGGLSSAVMMCGINDIFRNGAPPKTVLKIQGAYRSIIVNTFLAFAKSADTLTNTGTWSNFTLIPGKANNLGGNMRQSSTAGDTITYTNIANVRNLVIGTVNTDGTIYNYGRFTVTVDGVLMATFDPNNRTDKVTDGTYDNGITHEALIFDTIWSSLTITLLDNKPTVIDYVGYMKTPERCQGFLAISPCKCTAVGYATPPAMGNDADVDIVTEAINSVVNEFINRPVAFLDTRKFYDPLTQSNADGIHPKNDGTEALSAGAQYNINYQSLVVGGYNFDQVASSDPSYVITDLSRTADHRKYEITNTGGNLFISRINDTLTTRMTAFAVADNGRVQINASAPNVTPAFSSALSVVGIFGVNSFSVRNNADTSTVFNISNAGVVTLGITPAPASPNDGDMWLESNTNTGLKIRINGITKTITLS